MQQQQVMMMMMQQSVNPGTALAPPHSQPQPHQNDVASSKSSGTQEAPPKQLASALDGLSRAIRLIAEVRSEPNQLLEAVELSDCYRFKNDGNKTAQVLSKAAESAKGAIEQLRAVGKELEQAGVLVGAQQRYQDNQPWGLHTPLVCPDGAMVSYSWKRQIAGQAAASAVDRTRLALKAFTEQKKRFLPHLDSDDECSDTVYKRSRRSDVDVQTPVRPSLPDVLKRVAMECPGMQVTAHHRAQWPPKPVNGLPRKAAGPGLDSVAVIDVVIPGVLRAIVSLLPSPPSTADAVAVFSTDEGGDHVHAWSTSSHKVYQRITECARNALHYYLRMHSDSSPLLLLLQWLFSYRTLFSKACGTCRRLIALDPSSNLLLPPVVRPFHINKTTDNTLAYHRSCIPGSEQVKS